MAEQKPLVIIDGVVQQLPDGDTVQGASGGITPEEEKELKNFAAAMAIALG